MVSTPCAAMMAIVKDVETVIMMVIPRILGVQVAGVHHGLVTSLGPTKSIVPHVLRVRNVIKVIQQHLHIQEDLILWLKH